MRRRVTFGRRAMDLVTAAVARYLDLTPGECSLAQNAEPLIIEGTPPAKTIFRRQDRQSLI